MPGSVGAEFEALFDALGVAQPPGCKCAWYAREMDRRGVAWCKDNEGVIAGWLRESYRKTGWLTRLSVAARAVRSGLALRLDDPLDPIPSLVREAIKRAEAKEKPVAAAKWAYGVTTCAARVLTLLPRTLASLAAAGFDRPRLFVDGVKGGPQTTLMGLECSFRYPTIRPFGNWILGLAELYVREPGADLFAVFQDDCVAVRNLRPYLDRVGVPDKGYLNLLTFDHPHQARPPAGKAGFYPSNQLGKSAVGLVLPRRAAQLLLCSESVVAKPLDPGRGWRTIDGAVCQALVHTHGYTEYVHWPSPLLHTGADSELQKMLNEVGDARDKIRKWHVIGAGSFPGESFDALSFPRG